METLRREEKKVEFFKLKKKLFEGFALVSPPEYHKTMNAKAV